MKIRFFLLLSISILLYSCKETLESYENIVKPALDTTFIASAVETPQSKKILIEEYTGVRCQNCPTGHDEVKNLLNIHKDKLLAISLHSKFLGNKYEFSAYDLLNDESESLYKEYGAGSKPAAMVDRSKFNNLTVLSRTEWGPAIDALKSKTSPVNIHIKNTNNASTKNYRIRAEMHFTEKVTDDLKYTIYIIENNITTAQLLPTGNIDSFYIHQHVLRKTLTDFNGNSLAGPYEKSKTYIKEFNYDVKPDQNPDNLNVIVSVHKSGAIKDILHCEERKLK